MSFKTNTTEDAVLIALVSKDKAEHKESKGRSLKFYFKLKKQFADALDGKMRIMNIWVSQL